MSGSKGKPAKAGALAWPGPPNAPHALLRAGGGLFAGGMMQPGMGGPFVAAPPGMFAPFPAAALRPVQMGAPMVHMMPAAGNMMMMMTPGGCMLVPNGMMMAMPGVPLQFAPPGLMMGVPASRNKTHSKQHLPAQAPRLQASQPTVPDHSSVEEDDGSDRGGGHQHAQRGVGASQGNRASSTANAAKKLKAFSGAAGPVPAMVHSTPLPGPSNTGQHSAVMGLPGAMVQPPVAGPRYKPVKLQPSSYFVRRGPDGRPLDEPEQERSNPRRLATMSPPQQARVTRGQRITHKTPHHKQSEEEEQEGSGGGGGSGGKSGSGSGAASMSKALEALQAIATVALAQQGDEGIAPPGYSSCKPVRRLEADDPLPAQFLDPDEAAESQQEQRAGKRKMRKPVNAQLLQMALQPMLVTEVVEQSNSTLRVAAHCPYGDFAGVLQFAGVSKRKRAPGEMQDRTQ